MTYWHEVNPWREHNIVYVPLSELAACLAGGTIQDVDGTVKPHSAELILARWQHTSELYDTPGQLDAYILPQPSGRHSAGVRYGAEGSQYFSPYVQRSADLQKLLDKYKKITVDNTRALVYIWTTEKKNLILPYTESKMKTDAKVYAMIGELSRQACADLILVMPGEWLSELHNEIRNRYESGTLSTDDIIAAWWNDEAVS